MDLLPQSAQPMTKHAFRSDDALVLHERGTAFREISTSGVTSGGDKTWLPVRMIVLSNDAIATY
jgi:hypothetical protein